MPCSRSRPRSSSSMRRRPVTGRSSRGGSCRSGASRRSTRRSGCPTRSRAARPRRPRCRGTPGVPSSGCRRVSGSCAYRSRRRSAGRRSRLGRRSQTRRCRRSCASEPACPASSRHRRCRSTRARCRADRPSSALACPVGRTCTPTSSGYRSHRNRGPCRRRQGRPRPRADRRAATAASEAAPGRRRPAHPTE